MNKGFDFKIPNISTNSSTFGASSTSTNSTTSTSTSTPSTATTTTTSAQPFKFNFNTSSTKTSTSTKSNETVKIPPELKGKKVKQIIETMESQLEQQVRQFNAQAGQVARWDRSIYDILDSMIFLEEEIKMIETSQKELKGSAVALLQDQENILKRLKEKNSSNQEDDSVASSDQRAKLYSAASKLGQEFHSIESELKKVVENTEMAESQDSISDIDKVVQISNCHLESLQWISNYCTSIEEKLNNIQTRIKLQDYA